MRDALIDAIPLTPAERQSGVTRVKWAENLSRQLPEDHDGRNSWLLNYGTGPKPPRGEHKVVGDAPARPCGIASPSYHECSNMKEVGGGMEGERYRCAICSKGYFLDYEDMK